jgi:hypothetical protein
MSSTAKLGKLAVAMLAPWQLYLPVAIAIVASTLPTAEPAQAQEESVTLLQAFGWDASKACYKGLIQFKNGSQHLVWYPNLIGAKVGSVVKLTYTGSGSSIYFNKLMNLGNGRESIVHSHLKIN